MKLHGIVWMLAGSFAVYASMAACSASKPDENAGGSAGVGASGTAGSGGSFDAGCFVDAMVDPVPDAFAFIKHGSRLKVRIWSADDGATMPATNTLVWFDTVVDAPCHFQRATDNTWRCLPVASYGYTGSADPACTARLVGWPQDCAKTATTTLAEGPSLGCGLGYANRVFDVGDEYLGSGFYYVDNLTGECYAASKPPGVTFYVLGAERPPADFVSGQIVTAP